MSDLIDRHEAIDALMYYTDFTKDVNYEDNATLLFQDSAIEQIRALPSAEPEIVRCKECIYYDPEHVENNGIRYDYKDMPKEAFDTLGTGLVNIEYGINVGGRCCRDYNVGYSEDKRIFVPETNYCGRAERRTDD